MKKQLCVMASSLVFSLSTLANTAPTTIESAISKLNWNGVDVVFIEDPRFPTFDLSIYFADGALSDDEMSKGASSRSFSMLYTGTPKKNQKEILEELEFDGSIYSSDVTHEFSNFNISGLAKNIDRSVKQVCHLMKNASFPEAELKKEFDQERAIAKTIVNQKGELAGLIFREASLSGTPYSYPVTGKVKDLDNLNSKKLREKLDYFLKDVKKRIYITGPKEVLRVEKIFAKDCGFSGEGKQFVRTVEKTTKVAKKTPDFIFVPVPDANQVQVRIGRSMPTSELTDPNLDILTSDFLGGGFTSRLMREVRTKRGLTYSIGSFIAPQKYYGRIGISTFTKNETTQKIIEVIDGVVTDIGRKGIKAEDFQRTKEGLVGSYPFKFEQSKAFLAQLMYLDHVERPYKDLFSFREEMEKYTSKDVQKRVASAFKFDKQTIVVIGDKSIEPQLKKLTSKYGPLKTVDYKDYL